MLGALKRRLLRLGEQCTTGTGTGNFRARALAIQRLLSSRVSSQALPLEFLLNPKQNTVARTVFQRFCGTLKSGFYTGSAIQFHVPKVRLQHVAVRHGPGVGGSTPPELQVASGQGRDSTGKAHDGHLSPAQATARTLGPSLHTPRVQYGREAPEARSPGEVKRKMADFVKGRSGWYLADHIPKNARALLRATNSNWVVADPGYGLPLALSDGRYISLSSLYNFLRCRLHYQCVPDAVRVAQNSLSATASRGWGLGQFLEYTHAMEAHAPMLTNFYSSHRRLNDVEWSHRLHRSLLNQLLTWIAPKPQDIICVGGNYRGMRAWKGLKTGSPLLSMLLTHFEACRRVVYIDEYFSSQKCAKCTAQLLPHTTRTKCCPSSTCKNAIYNRDANAAENLAKIWEACLDGKDRPSQLRRPAVPPQRRGPGRTSTARRQPQPEVPVPVTPGLPLAVALSGPVAAGARGAAGAASGQ